MSAVIRCCQGGPCQQGRKPCPTPAACQVAAEEQNFYDWRWVLGSAVDGLVAAALVASVVGGFLMVWWAAL